MIRINVSTNIRTFGGELSENNVNKTVIVSNERLQALKRLQSRTGLGKSILNYRFLITIEDYKVKAKATYDELIDFLCDTKQGMFANRPLIKKYFIGKERI